MIKTLLKNIKWKFILFPHLATKRQRLLFGKITSQKYQVVSVTTWSIIRKQYPKNYNAEKVIEEIQELYRAGNIRKSSSPLFLGGVKFFSKMEEVRISDIARDSFGSGDDGGGDPVEIVTQVQREFYYVGWQVIEERQSESDLGQVLPESTVFRQYIDGLGIDDHLQLAMYSEDGSEIDQELFYHTNHRMDTVALTNDVGETVLRLEYSAYGEVFSVNENGELEEFSNFSIATYFFQGRRVDEETGVMYFRNRYYSPEQGRFLSRDPLGYGGGGKGLHEAFGGNSVDFVDPLGEELLRITAYNGVHKTVLDKSDNIDGLSSIKAAIPTQHTKFPSTSRFGKHFGDATPYLYSKFKELIELAISKASKNKDAFLDIQLIGHCDESGKNMLVAPETMIKVLIDLHKAGSFKNVKLRSMFFQSCWSCVNHTDSDQKNFLKDLFDKTDIQSAIVTDAKVFLDGDSPTLEENTQKDMDTGVWTNKNGYFYVYDGKSFTAMASLIDVFGVFNTPGLKNGTTLKYSEYIKYLNRKHINQMGSHPFPSHVTSK